ncbi:DegT/DnrJ/EryC1/StrS family aminotransferase [Flavobacterium silvaticum]|uniref:Aminotransferase class I/II-fold pyridoxal phosphate-dependent enzyme n=1 Tax=Flavobacterium silvaticum TaxID=1852020 RepID=A0A972G2V7_9FLAO|nr:aminotransferase class I/II-fold pyridoxal phosphate-dependent enzyme [Flavobacterium silvaticum]NMH29496.1 aminotransferase class I/II-fold pyridoxal phosphate-dependent enzyme [Flavobacterium silvaticum]
MSNPKIWLSSPHMGGSEQKFVNEAFDTNWVAPLGPNVTGFESDLENYLGGTHHVAALSSGTSALHLALILAGVKAGDSVICQSFTFSASANPIVYLGAEPVFVDSEETTWNMCPDTLEEAIKAEIKTGKKPKAIVAVHLYGMPFQADSIRKIADSYEITLIEDSAEALGSSFNGQPCGTFGDIGILSFNGNKIITTSGGGALVSKDKSVKDKAVFLATQARDAAPHYQHSEIGYNYRLSNICAGIGRGQMEVLDKHVANRREMNAFYKELFKPFDFIKVFAEADDRFESNHWLSCITIDPSSGKNREGMRLALEADNIECRPLWKPMHLQPVFENCRNYTTGVSEKLFENGLCLPSGSNLTNEDKDRLKTNLLNYIQY